MIGGSCAVRDLGSTGWLTKDPSIFSSCVIFELDLKRPLVMLLVRCPCNDTDCADMLPARLVVACMPEHFRQSSSLKCVVGREWLKWYRARAPDQNFYLLL